MHFEREPAVDWLAGGHGECECWRAERKTTLATCGWLPHHQDVDEPPALQHNGHWRMAVWALRAGCVALAVGIAGLIVMLSGSTPWVLAAGEITWLAAAGVALTGFFWARHELPRPRPGYWSMRLMLIRDTIHSLPSSD